MELFAFKNECGEIFYYAHKDFESFHNTVADFYFEQVFEEGTYTREEVEKYIDECPYMQFFHYTDKEYEVEITLEVQELYLDRLVDTKMIKVKDLLKDAYEGEEVAWLQ